MNCSKQTGGLVNQGATRLARGKPMIRGLVKGAKGHVQSLLGHRGKGCSVGHN